MKSTRPEWRIPADLHDLIAADADLTWATDEWAPLELSVMAGTSYAGRDIPLAWQVEFEPTNPSFEGANAKISAMGGEPDGYGWSKVIASIMGKYHPDASDELQYGDTETSACVIWTESEQTCRRMVEVIWNLINE
jgi:hypothetical protein